MLLNSIEFQPSDPGTLQYLTVPKSNIVIEHCLKISPHRLLKSTLVRTISVRVKLTTILSLLQLRAEIAYLIDWTFLVFTSLKPHSAAISFE